jgi:tetratricopeptide (TPR) repeat protein
LRRTNSLVWINLAVWALVLALGLAYRGELQWAAERFDAYRRNAGFEPLHEFALRNEALGLLRTGDDLERAGELLERSLAIDPNTDAVALLAEVRLLGGSPEQAYPLYERYSRIDPGNPMPWLRMAELHRAAERPDEARTVLERGIGELRRLVELWQPRPDPEVDAAANARAEEMHERYRAALERLERAAADQFSGAAADPDIR